MWDAAEVDEYGKRANDDFNDMTYNSVYRIRNRELCLIATRDINIGEEIYAPYGREYWQYFHHELSKEARKKCFKYSICTQLNRFKIFFFSCFIARKPCQ